MQQEEKLKYFSVALYAFGVIFILGVPANDDVDLAFRLGMDTIATRI